MSDQPNKQTIWRLLKEALDDLPEAFTSAEAVAWFEDRGHTYRPVSIQTHLHDLSVNRRGGQVSQPPPGGEAFLYRRGRGVFTRYRPEVHGNFTVDGQLIDDDADGDSDVEELTEAQSEFALEVHLEEFMEANWSQIDFGAPLEIWEDDEGLGGRQYQTGTGPIDFLCHNTATGDFVVVELKRAKTTDQAVGQCLRYMGWVEHELAKPGQSVRGLIIAHEADDRIKYALSPVPSIDLMTYEVSFALKAAGLIPAKGERRE